MKRFGPGLFQVTSLALLPPKYQSLKAKHSISTSTPNGNFLTSTQLLAGLTPPLPPVKCFEYSSFICLKSLSISVRKTVVLTTLSKLEPAASRMADMFAIQAAVFSDMLADWGRGEVGRWGIWPETKIKAGVRTAWDCIFFLKFFFLVLLAGVCGQGVGVGGGS